jgi:hypothetical protein
MDEALYDRGHGIHMRTWCSRERGEFVERRVGGSVTDVESLHYELLMIMDVTRKSTCVYIVCFGSCSMTWIV